jgi:hypothetical protein
MSPRIEALGKRDSEPPIITGSDDQSPPKTAGSGSTPAPKGKAGPGHIETPPNPLPPAPAEASLSALLPNQHTAAVRKSAREAVNAFLDAKDELLAAQADTSLSRPERGIRISFLEQKVAILQPMALLLSNNYYVRAEENAAVAEQNAGKAELNWSGDPDNQQKAKAYEDAKAFAIKSARDLDTADRLRDQAREIGRGFGP